MRDDNVRRELREALHERLPSEAAARLSYHLGDIRWACAEVDTCIAQLAALDQPDDPRELRTLLSRLIGQLYEHLPTHLAGARDDLECWTTRLFEEADRRGEL